MDPTGDALPVFASAVRKWLAAMTASLTTSSMRAAAVAAAAVWGGSGGDGTTDRAMRRLMVPASADLILAGDLAHPAVLRGVH